MSITWIIILSLFILIILVIAIRAAFSFFNKKENKTDSEIMNISDKNNEYEQLFIELETIYELNIKLQNKFKNNVSSVNNFILFQLNNLMNSPTYIFKSHIRDFDILVSNFANKLVSESPYIWNRKFKEPASFLKYKNIEFKNKQNELINYSDKILEKKMEEWNEWKK